jgi:hypothetical protein
LKLSVHGARKAGLKTSTTVSSTQAAKTRLNVQNNEETFLFSSLAALSPTIRQYKNAINSDVTRIPQNIPPAHVIDSLLNKLILHTHVVQILKTFVTTEDTEDTEINELFSLNLFLCSLCPLWLDPFNLLNARVVLH